MTAHFEKIDFDVLVTGQLTHEILGLEQDVNGIISDFFITDPSRKAHFERTILHREGLTFQDKIEIVQCLIPVFAPISDQVKLKAILERIKELKDFRNAMAHGVDASTNDTPPLTLRVEMISRSGKAKVKEITPASHTEMMEKARVLQEELSAAREELRQRFSFPGVLPPP